MRRTRCGKFWPHGCSITSRTDIGWNRRAKYFATAGFWGDRGRVETKKAQYAPERSEGDFLNFRVNARAVLELGSELISSDIIAFYELIKNAFDAGSKSGADIRFRIAMRRNTYLRLRGDALTSLSTKASKAERAEQLSDLISRTTSKIDPAVGEETVSKFAAAIEGATDMEDFLVRLDACYDEHNSIEVSDAGSGMSIPEITNNFLTLGTPARKREVEQILKQGGSKAPLGEKGIGRLSAMRLGHLL